MREKISAAQAGHLPVFALCALAAALIDLPFRTIGFLGLAPTVGPKNILPLLFGLMFGPSGSLGVGAGVLISALVRGNLDSAAWWEGAIVAIISWLCWILWYLPKIACIPSLKKPRILVKFILFTLGTGCALGAALALFPAARYGLDPFTAGLQVACSVFVWSLLVGMPAIVTMTSVFAVVPVMPRSYWERGQSAMKPDLTLELTPTGGLIGVGDAVEEFNMDHKIPMKRGYAIMSCVEEIAVLLLSRLSEGETLAVGLKAGDNVTIRFTYRGPRYNPLAAKSAKGLSNLDNLGILLVREMATAAGYSRRRGINRIKIVV
jgi:hypothetical protein